MEAGAVQLFKELPTALRERFEKLPDIQDELCCRAEELRGETGSQDELSRVIGALERVRLDLMRLKAGEGSADQVGAALEAAEKLNEETGSRRAVRA